MSIAGLGLFWFIIFNLMAGVIVMVIIIAVRSGNQNNRSPVLTVDAVVIGKRTSDSWYTNPQTGATTMQTSYYAAFQVQSGDRLEFPVISQQYHTLTEGEYGKLSFQGTRLLGFAKYTATV